MKDGNDNSAKNRCKKDLVLTEITPYEQERFSVRESHSEDDIIEIKRKLMNQQRAISEFENYIGILLNSMTANNINDYSEQINKGLEKVENLYKENVEYKRLLIKEMKKGEELNRQIEVTKSQIKLKSDEIKFDKIGKLICEKKELLKNLSTISGELDDYSERNNLLIDTFKFKQNKTELEKLKEEINALKNENQSIKERILCGNKKAKKFKFSNSERDSNIFSCFNKQDEETFTINFKANINLFK